MKTKLLKVLSLVVLISLLAAPAAYASDDVHTVHCEGSGYAYMHGGGTIDLSGRSGMLTYHDIGGDGTLTASGQGRRITRGAWTLIYGFNGSVHAGGSNIAVFLIGRNIVLDATGRGVLRVRGVGFCTVDGVPLKWTPDSQEIKVGE